MLYFGGEAEGAACGTQSCDSCQVDHAALVEAMHGVGLVIEAQRECGASSHGAVTKFHHFEAWPKATR